MNTKIRTSQFCSLSTEKAFHDWLLRNDTILHKDLIDHLSKNPTCSQNRDKMIQIQKHLIQKGLFSKLVDFLKLSFPHVVQEPGKTIVKKKNNSTIKLRRVPAHIGLFRSYNPNRLTFPHKMVLYNKDKKQLRLDALSFCKDKVGCDHLIIGEYAFIEYFHQRYKEESYDVPDKMREIVMYRKRKGIDPASKNI